MLSFYNVFRLISILKCEFKLICAVCRSGTALPPVPTFAPGRCSSSVVVLVNMHNRNVAGSRPLVAGPGPAPPCRPATSSHVVGYFWRPMSQLIHRPQVSSARTGPSPIPSNLELGAVVLGIYWWAGP